MIDVGTMINALRLSWISRLLIPEIGNWKTVPDFYLRKSGGLNFLLRCNYDVKYRRLALFLQRYSYLFQRIKKSVQLRQSERHGPI